MEFREALIIVKEVKNVTDIFFRGWAKIQIRFEIFEKVLKFTYKNLNRKVIFYKIFYPLFHDRPLSFYTPLQHSKSWGWSRRVVLLRAWGRGTFEWHSVRGLT